MARQGAALARLGRRALGRLHSVAGTAGGRRHRFRHAGRHRDVGGTEPLPHLRGGRRHGSRHEGRAHEDKPGQRGAHNHAPELRPAACRGRRPDPPPGPQLGDRGCPPPDDAVSDDADRQLRHDEHHHPPEGVVRRCAARRKLYRAVARPLADIRHGGDGSRRAAEGDVAHELRTPLTIIQTSAELLHMKGAHVGEAKRNELLERILGSCQSLHDLLNIFLNLARNTSFEIQESDTVHDTLNSMVGYYHPYAKEKGLELIFEVKDTCPGFYSPVVIGTIAGNLIKNALLYTAQGYVKVTETATGFEVVDTGPGIDSENKDRIFSPHTRATDQQQGSGMGLSIVKRLCDRFGWRVELVSHRPQGACFRVELLTGKPVARVDQSR